MSHAEFARWREFYQLYPFDDRHRYHRPAALVASAFGGDLQARLDWLQPPPQEPASGDLSDADLTTLRAFGYGADLKPKH